MHLVRGVADVKVGFLGCGRISVRLQVKPSKKWVEAKLKHNGSNCTHKGETRRVAGFRKTATAPVCYDVQSMSLLFCCFSLQYLVNSNVGF